jgi:hypothetical protein
MTSQINYSAIDATYPVAGQDNDSQGFRDNFGATIAALTVAKTELTELQTKAILNAPLTNGIPVEDENFNNLLGQTVKNGVYRDFHGQALPVVVEGTSYDVDVTLGDYFALSLQNDNTTITFTNWPEDERFAKVRVQLSSYTNSGDKTPILSNGTNKLVYTKDFPSSGNLPQLELSPTLDSNTQQPVPKIIEAWTYNAGATVYVRYLGEFTTPSDDRTIVGDFTVNGQTYLVETSVGAFTARTDSNNMGSTTISNLTVTNGTNIKSLTSVGTIVLGNSSSDGGAVPYNTITMYGIPKLPVLSSTQRNDLAATPGMTIYNLTTNRLEICTSPGQSGTATWEGVLSGIPVLPSLTATERNNLTARVGMTIVNTTASKVQTCTSITPSVIWADLS